jgi:hypothetical protein
LSESFCQKLKITHPMVADTGLPKVEDAKKRLAEKKSRG